MKEGKVHKPSAAPGKGSGKNTRDSSVAKASAGGSTKVIDKTKSGHLKRSSGSMKSYC